jgi:hypothetical protein
MNPPLPPDPRHPLPLESRGEVLSESGWWCVTW